MHTFDHFFLVVLQKCIYTFSVCSCPVVVVPPPPSVRSPGSPCLGLDVEELAEDCSAVRSQLEYLQRLLLQVRDEEEGINTKVHSVQNYQFSSFAFNV